MVPAFFSGLIISTLEMTVREKDQIQEGFCADCSFFIRLINLSLNFSDIFIFI